MYLGPHQETFEQKPKHFDFTRVKRAAFRPHTIPSLLIMIAMLSFAGNLAFAYLGFVKEGNSPEIHVAGITDVDTDVKGKLGSDDGEYSPPNFTPSIHFKIVSKPASLKVSAESYVVADAETGEVILEKNADTAFPMASVSKLITAIVSKEQIDSRHIATVSKDSYNTYGAEGQLTAGEKILVSDLYYPLLIESSNDAAEVLANDFGREAFITLLNEKAAMLGMYSTNFNDPSGLSPKNVSTAHDLTKLGLYIYESYPEILDITRVKGHSIFGHSWINQNVFLTYPNFLGGKNGFINEAKKTTLSYFKVFFRTEDPTSKAVDRPVIVVLLRSDNRDGDTATLLSYVAKNIRYVLD